MINSPTEVLLATVGELWPHANEVALTTGSQSASEASVGFRVIPHARRPRILVPAGNRRAAAAAMRRFSAGLSTLEVVGRLGVAGALRTPAASLFRERVVVRGAGGDSLSSYIASVLGTKVEVSLSIGPPRANRKPVLEVFDSEGRSIAYVKVGNTPVAEQNVRGEAFALARIAGRLGAELRVPEVLHTGTWRGMFVLIMSALPTTPWKRPSKHPSFPIDTAESMAEAFAEAPKELTHTPLWQRMMATAEGLADATFRSQLTEALQVLSSRAGDRALRVGAWHGDWTPWNMARRRGKVQLWDWERFETGVPIGLDALHYGVNTMTRSRGENLDAVRAGLDFSGMGRTSLLAGIYLAAITSRYAASAQNELGHLVSARAELMKKALLEWMNEDWA